MLNCQSFNTHIVILLLYYNIYFQFTKVFTLVLVLLCFVCCMGTFVMICFRGIGDLRSPQLLTVQLMGRFWQTQENHSCFADIPKRSQHDHTGFTMETFRGRRTEKNVFFNGRATKVRVPLSHFLIFFLWFDH